MSNNYNNLSQVPKLSFRGLLSDPKGCLCMYDHQSFVQIAGGLILISKFMFDSDSSPVYTSFPLHSVESSIIDLAVTSDGKITTLTLNKFGFYQLIIYTDGKATTLKLDTKDTAFVRSFTYDNQICYTFQGKQPDSYTQIIWFQSLLKKIKATGIISQKVKFCTIDDAKLSILLKHKIQHYRSQNKSLCYEVSSNVQQQIIGFVQLSDRLATYTNDKISIYKQQRLLQTIKLTNIKQILAVTLGFIAMREGKMYHYQRRGDLFIQMDLLEINNQFSKMEISKKQHLILLQAENGQVSLIDLDNNRIDENDNKRSFGRIFSVRGVEEHISIVSISNESNPYLIVIKQQTSELIVFSKITLQQILVYKIDTSPIYDCQLESNRPYFLLSVAGVIRKFYILYDHIQETIQINLRARKLVLSQMSTYVACLVGSANYSKVQILLEDDLKDVAGLWIGQEVVDIVWSDHDFDLYVVLEKGYERYSLMDNFGIKKKKQFKHNVVSVGGYSKSNGLVVLLQDMTVNIIKNQEIITSIRQQQPICSISVSGNILYTTNLKGALFYNLINSKYTPSQSKLFSGEFQIISSLTNQVICLSKDRTTLFILKQSDTEKQRQSGELSNMQDKINNNLLQKDITFVERSFIKQIMKKQKNHEHKSHLVYEQMQDTVKEIQKRYERTLDQQKKQFANQIKDVENSLQQQIQHNKNLEREVRQNKEKYENEQLKALGQLQKLYDRKITLLTNKLMTQNEISMRNTIESKENITVLHQNYKKEIGKIHANFDIKIKSLEENDLSEKQKNQKLVREYEERLAQQYQESQNLVKEIQIQYQQMISNQRRTIFQWQEKYKQCVVQKINTQQAINKLKEVNEELMKKNYRQQENIEHERKRISFLNKEIQKCSKHIKDLQVQLDRERAKSYELEQSNQILGFKILENRETILPKEKKLEELKEKFCSFEIEYQKVLTDLSDQSQVIDQLRKENVYLKKEVVSIKDVQEKQNRNFINLLYDIKEIVTETPTEDWNKKISFIYQDINNRGLFPNQTQHIKKNKKSMIQEIDRSKNHLELCLKQVITSNNKIQERKSYELLKKLKENADLLQQINQLRTKLKKYQLMDPLKLKEKEKSKEKDKDKEREKDFKFGKRSLSYKKQESQRQRVQTEVIQEQEQPSNFPAIQNTPTSKNYQSRRFQSTSVDFRRSVTTKKQGDRIPRNTVRKTPIHLTKMKRNQIQESEEIEFLYRKLQLQDKIIISLRAKINGLNI